MSDAYSIATKTLRSIGDAFDELGRRATAVGVAITASLGAATFATVKASSEYEKNLQAIATVTDESAEGLERLGQGQRDLAKQFGSDLGSQMEGLYDALSAGVTNAAQSTEYMATVNKLSVGGITDVKVAGEAMIRMLRAYGTENLSAAKAADILLQVSNVGVTTFNELAPSIGRVAGISAQAGIPIEELGAAIATMTGTARPEEAITQMTALISDIVRPSESAAKAAQQMGLDFGAVALSTQGLNGFMQRLRQTLGITVDKELAGMLESGASMDTVMEKLAASTGLQTQKLAELFPNVNALRGALGLMANNGQDFAESLKAMSESQGAVDEAFKKMDKAGSQTLAKLKAAGEDFKITIGQALAPALFEMLNRLTPIVDSITRWIKENPQLTAQIAEMTIGVLAGGAALTAFGLAMSGIGQGIGLASAAIRVVLSLLGGFSLLLSPIGILFVALGAIIAGVAAAWIQRVGGIEAAWRIVSERVLEWGGRIVSWFQAVWPIVWEAVASRVLRAGTAIVDWFVRAWPTIQKYALATWTWIQANVLPVAVEVFGFLLEVATGVIDWFRERWPAIVETFSIVWNQIQRFWDQVGRPIWNGIVEFIRDAWELIKDVVRAAGQVLSGIIDVFMGLIRGNWEQIWTGIRSVVGGVWNGITSIVQFGMNTILNIASTIGNTLIGVLAYVWESITGGFIHAWTIMRDFFRSVWQQITGWIRDIFGAASNLASAIGGSISEAFGYLRDLVGFRDGGYVTGPAGIDRVPAMLTSGEFVVTPEATNMFGPILEAMNSMGRSGGTGGSSTSYFGDVNVNLPSVRDGRQAARTLSAELQRLVSRGQGATNRRGLR